MVAAEITNLLIISKRTDESIRLKEDLSRIPGYKVRFEETAESAMRALTQENTDCVLIIFEKFGLQQVKLIRDVRDVSKISQVLILTNEAEDNALKAIK